MSGQLAPNTPHTASRWPGRLALIGLCVEVAVATYFLTHLPKETLERWIYALIPIAVCAVGGLVSVVALLGNPRSRRAQLSFGLHGAAVLFVVLAWKYEHYQDGQRVAADHAQNLLSERRPSATRCKWPSSPSS